MDKRINNNKIRVLLIHNFYQYWGGEDSYVTSLKKLLEENGHEVYLYSKDSKKIKTFLDKIKVGIGLFFNPWIKRELEQIIINFKPDVAHFHNVYPLIGATAYRVCKKFNVKIVQHIHNYRFMCPKGLLFRNGKICELCVGKKFPFWAIFFGCYHQSKIASLFLSLSFYFHRLIKTFDMINKYIFPSEFTRDYYLKYLKIDKRKTFLPPYFVEVPKNLPKKVKKENYFLYVGRLSEEKGIIQLLEIFKDLPEHKLLVIGDGPLRQEVEKYKKYKNIQIFGHKPREKVFEYIAKSKAVIISSIWYEVLPLVLIEAILSKSKIFIPNLKQFTTFTNKFDPFNEIFYYNLSDFEELKNKIIKLNKEFEQSKIKKTKNFFNFNIFYYKRHMKQLLKFYNN